MNSDQKLEALLFDQFVFVNCDLCGANDTRRCFTIQDTNYDFPGAFSVVECQWCGLVYLNPRPREEVIGDYYPNENYTCFKELRAHGPLDPSHPTLRVAQGQGITVKKLCDVGCGSGDFLVRAKLAGIEVAGIEPSNYARQLANTRLGSGAVWPSFTSASFASNTFDAVTMWHVLEHVPSPHQTLKEVYRILRPGGLLSFAVPNFASLERRVWGGQWIAIDAPRHFYHFRVDNLRRYLEVTNFHLIIIEQHIGAISLSSNVLRTIRRAIIDPRKLQRKDTNVLPEGETYGSIPKSVNHSKKHQIRKTTTDLMYPLAWLIARLKLGPELMVHAYKNTSSE